MRTEKKLFYYSLLSKFKASSAKISPDHRDSFHESREKNNATDTYVLITQSQSLVKHRTCCLSSCCFLFACLLFVLGVKHFVWSKPCMPIAVITIALSNREDLKRNGRLWRPYLQSAVVHLLCISVRLVRHQERFDQILIETVPEATDGNVI